MKTFTTARVRTRMADEIHVRVYVHHGGRKRRTYQKVLRDWCTINIAVHANLLTTNHCKYCLRTSPPDAYCFYMILCSHVSHAPYTSSGSSG